MLQHRRTRPLPSEPSGGTPTLEALAAGPPDGTTIEPAPSRLSRVVPLVRGAVRTVRRVAALSAASAAVVWWAFFGESVQAGRLETLDAVVVALLLLAPAALSWLGAWTLQDVASLPGRLRAGASDVAERTRGVAGEARGGLLGVVRAVWAARALVVEGRDGWLRAAALVRVARLASLPFALGLVAAFAANFLVIAGGLVALLVLVL